MSDTFQLTAEHIKLFAAAYVGWDDCEYGAPAIDCKHPYGDGDVPESIAKILNWPVYVAEEEDNDGYDEMCDRARDIHEEMRTALQIVLSTLSFVPGKYTSEDYGFSWKLVT